MAWSKGQLRGKKTGGRKAGTPNKTSQEFQLILEEYGICAGEALLTIYAEQMEIYKAYKKQKNYDGMASVLRDASRTVGNMCEYTYPKMKAIEHVGEPAKTFADFVFASHSRVES